MWIQSRQLGAVRRCALVVSAGLLTLSLVLSAPAADEAPQTPQTPPRPAAVPAYRQASQVAVLTVHGEIDHVTLHSLERRMAEARRNGANAIVLDIDTPGGRLDATLDICNLLKDPSLTPTNTVAWIHPQAYSAGTIIALACREIVVSPNATFGDAAPIQGIPGLGLTQLQPAERAKVEAPLLAEVVDSARRHHYDENLVQSFVSVGIELWMIENVDTGERVFVDRTEYETVFGEEPADEITSVTPSAPTTAPAPRVRPKVMERIPLGDSADELGLTPEQYRQQIEYQQNRPPRRDPLTRADRGSWRPVMQVITDDRLLTLKPAEALHYGLAVRTISSDAQLLTFFGAQSLRRYDATWSEGLVRLLVSVPVKIILIIVFLLSLFIELAAPGVGVFGATAFVALLVLIGAPYLAGLAQWWDVLLIGLGIVLLAAELFLIPGTGVAGIAGALCLLAGIIGTFISGDLSSEQGMDELWTGVLSTFTALFAAGVGAWVVSRQIHSLPVLDKLILKTEVGARTTGAAGGLLSAMGDPPRTLELGVQGIAITDLRPAGRAEIDGRIVDVQSVGSYIEKGRPVRVTSVGRYVIEVEESHS
ncbi:MAG: hypothetical protein HKO59_04745 [Phycisphaerales bacterium]|nr:hypothetical protein [Phycisphaerales bacterium]NNM25285.1 hypothetical protein [Phycisphaerales bacterium]